MKHASTENRIDLSAESSQNDSWFADQNNLDEVYKGIDEAMSGKTVAYTLDEIKSMLGV